MPRAGQVFLGLADGVGAEVENAGGQHGVRLAFDDGVDHVLRAATAAGRDDRHADGFGDGAREGDVVAVEGAVGVHAGEEDFAGAKLDDALRPLDGVEAGAAAAGEVAAVGADLPFVGPNALAVHGDDYALAAESRCSFGDELRILDGGGVDSNFVGACFEGRPHFFDCSDAAGDREGDEDFIGDFAGHVEHGPAAAGRSGYVKEHELVGAAVVVGLCQRDGITGVTRVEEGDALDDSTVLDVEAGNDAFDKHSSASLAGVALLYQPAGALSTGERMAVVKCSISNRSHSESISRRRMVQLWVM